MNDLNIVQPLLHSPNGHNSWELVHTVTRSLEIVHFGLPQGWLEPKYLVHLLLLSQAQ